MSSWTTYPIVRLYASISSSNEILLSLIHSFVRSCYNYIILQILLKILILLRSRRNATSTQAKTNNSTTANTIRKPTGSGKRNNPTLYHTVASGLVYRPSPRVRPITTKPLVVDSFVLDLLVQFALIFIGGWTFHQFTKSNVGVQGCFTRCTCRGRGGDIRNPFFFFRDIRNPPIILVVTIVVDFLLFDNKPFRCRVCCELLLAFQHSGVILGYR